MKSYSESRFSQREIECLALAGVIVGELPDVDRNGDSVRCHEVARLVAQVINSHYNDTVLYVQDGSYGFVEHSWLWTSPPPKEYVGIINAPNVLDPYSVGQLPQVQLVDCSSSGLPHFGYSYRLGDWRKDIKEDFIASHVRQLKELIESQAVQYWMPNSLV